MKSNVVGEHPPFKGVLILHVAVVNLEHILESVYHKFHVAAALVVSIYILWAFV